MEKLKKYCPLPSLIIYCIFILSVIVLVISKLSVPFSDFFNENISSVFRAVLAKITNFLPFSLAESFLLSIPFVLFLLLKNASNYYEDSKRGFIRYALTLMSAVALVYSILFLNFSCAYNATTLDKKLGIERKEVTAQELADTAEILLENANELSKSVNYVYGSSSYMPYSLTEMNDKLNIAYKRASEKYPFIQDLYSNVKPVMLSKIWTYTHVTGIYTFFTGEANINTNIPDYTIPYTAAHELAHQRGFAREEEANFVAFLVCLESDDEYIRYSAYMNVYEYVSSALYTASEEKYSEATLSMNGNVRMEMIAFNNFFKKYENNVAATVSSAVNNTYLQAQGQSEGEKSYGLVVDLAVAYYESQK